MTLQLETQQPAKPREQQILDIFDANGRALSLRMLAKECITAGVWAQSEIEAIAVTSVMESCRRVLSKKDTAGLPVNGPTQETDPDGAPVWKARQLWLFGDYEQNVAVHLGQRNENHVVAVALAHEAADRYGQVIVIGPLP